MANSTTEERKDSVEVEVSESRSPNNNDGIRWNDWGSWRENIEHVLEMHRFHMVVITLVVLDVLIVTLQLLIDHDIIKVPHDKKHAIEHGLHTTSIAILALFVAELFLKLAVFRLEFFKKYFEVFDGVVVIVSFILDVLPQSVHTSAAELVIIARLWRVARIINGIILSITTAKEEEIKKLKKSITILEEENEKLKGENDMLHKKLEELEG